MQYLTPASRGGDDIVGLGDRWRRLSPPRRTRQTEEAPTSIASAVAATRSAQAAGWRDGFSDLDLTQSVVREIRHSGRCGRRRSVSRPSLGARTSPLARRAPGRAYEGRARERSGGDRLAAPSSAPPVPIRRDGAIAGLAAEALLSILPSIARRLSSLGAQARPSGGAGNAPSPAGAMRAARPVAISEGLEACCAASPAHRPASTFQPPTSSCREKMRASFAVANRRNLQPDFVITPEGPNRA